MMGRLETMTTAPSQTLVFGVKAPAAQDFGSIFAAALATPAEVLGEPGEDQHDGDAPKDPRVAQHPSTETTPASVPTVHQLAPQLAHHGARRSETLVPAAPEPDMQDSITAATSTAIPKETLVPNAAPAAALSLPLPFEGITETQPKQLVPNSLPAVLTNPVSGSVVESVASMQDPVATPAVTPDVAVPVLGAVVSPEVLTPTPTPMAQPGPSLSAAATVEAAVPVPGSVVAPAVLASAVPVPGSVVAPAVLASAPTPRSQPEPSRPAAATVDAIGPASNGNEPNKLIIAPTPSPAPASSTATPLNPTAALPTSAPTGTIDATAPASPAVATMPAEAPAAATAPVTAEAPAPASVRTESPRPDSPRLEAPPTPEQVRQVYRQLAAPAIHMATSAEGVKTMTIRLHPEELGQITVVARLQGTNTHIELVPGADTSRELVRAILPELRRDLANHHAEASLDLNEEPARQEPEHSRHEPKITKATAGEKLPNEPDATHQTRGAGRLDISA